MRPEPFRFQSVSYSRDPSPAPAPPADKPRKLKRNPNGTLRWNGAGSAKQIKSNRYGSPAFGTAQITPEKPKADGKRRKLDDGSPSTPPRGPTTSPQASRTNGPTTPKLSISTPPPSRLRAPSVTKPTTPIQPSPLRQAWQMSPDSSQESVEKTPPPPASQPSETAHLMSELIKQATPPKKPDLSNPYQTASPTAKVGPPRRSTRRFKPPTPEQVNGKAAETKEPTETLNDVTAHVVVESTVPKVRCRWRVSFQNAEYSCRAANALALRLTARPALRRNHLDPHLSHRKRRLQLLMKTIA